MDTYKKISDKPSIGIAQLVMIVDRIDAGYYKSVFVENEERILNSGLLIKKLGDMWIEANYGSLPDSADYQEQGDLLLIRGTDLKNYTVSLSDDSLVKIPSDYYQKFKKARVLPGDILLLVKGASIDRSDSCAVMPYIEQKAIINGSVFKIRLKDDFEKHYVAAFMFSKPFLLQKRRAVTNTGAYYNDLSTIQNYLVPIPQERIQEYIGAKIRLAEKCRNEALFARNQANKLLQDMIEIDHENVENKGRLETFNRINAIPYCVAIAPNILKDRLTAISYNQNFLDFIETINSSPHRFVELGKYYEISAMIGWKNLTTKDYVENGIKMLRVADIKNQYISLDDAVQVSIEKVMEQSQIHLKEDDIVLSKDGTLGIAALIPPVQELLCAGSTLARLRRKKQGITPLYLAAYLNSKFTAAQISYFTNGIAQPHITQEYIRKIQVPDLNEAAQNDIGNFFHRFEFLSRKANSLINEAIDDIERLIDGELDINGILSQDLNPPTWEDIEKMV